MMVEGEAALLVRRWRANAGAGPSAKTSRRDRRKGRFWPADLTADFTDTPVAVVRTFASWRALPEITEGMTKFARCLFAAARHTIYLEAQYLTAPKVGERAGESLARPQGPEIVVIVRRLFTSRLEKFVMGGNQARLVQRLRKADHHGRLGVYYPVVPKPDGETCRSRCIPRPYRRQVSCALAPPTSPTVRPRSIPSLTSPSKNRQPGNHEGPSSGIREKVIAEHLDCSPQDSARHRPGEGSLLRGHRQPRLQEALPAVNLPRSRKAAVAAGVRHLAARPEAAFLPVPAQERGPANH